MNGKLARHLLPTIIECLDKAGENQTEINACYDSITDLLLDEARSSMKNVSRKHKNTKYKEYWDKELSHRWKLMHNSEKAYRRSCKEKQSVNHCKFYKKLFQNNKCAFDKLLRKKKRQHYAGLSLKLEACNTRSPNEFWNYIKWLGP